MTSSNQLDALSDREKEVAQAASNGLSNEEIGTILKPPLLATTIKVHLRNIFKALGISRRTQLLKYFRPQRVYDVTPPTDDRTKLFLNEMALHFTDSEIAESLDMSINVVNSTVSNLRDALGLSSRHELVMWWMAHTKMVEQSDEPFPPEQAEIIKQRQPRTRRAREPDMAE